MNKEARNRSLYSRNLACAWQCTNQGEGHGLNKWFGISIFSCGKEYN
jgi:hypothetical protein